MLVQYHWLWSLLFAVSTSALLSSNSLSHRTSTVSKSIVPTSSLHTTSTTKRSVVSTTSSHPTSTTKKTVSSTKSSSYLSTTTKKSATSTKSTKTSTASSTPTLSTFYLVSENTGLTDYDGVYLHEDPNAGDPNAPFMLLSPTNKNVSGAASFNLLANGTLQYNGAIGPQFATVLNGHPEDQPVTFEFASLDGRNAQVQLTCKIAAGAVTCISAQTGADTFTFLLSPFNGGSASLDISQDVDYNPITLKVVPV